MDSEAIQEPKLPILCVILAVAASIKRESRPPHLSDFLRQGPVTKEKAVTGGRISEAQSANHGGSAIVFFRRMHRLAQPRPSDAAQHGG
jgi:hypothetical protein